MGDRERTCFTGWTCVRFLSSVWLFVTTWTLARQAPLAMGFSRQEDEWVGISFSRGSSDPGIKPTSPASPALRGFFTSRTVGEAPQRVVVSIKWVFSCQELSCIPTYVLKICFLFLFFIITTEECRPPEKQELCYVLVLWQSRCSLKIYWASKFNGWKFQAARWYFVVNGKELAPNQSLLRSERLSGR